METIAINEISEALCKAQHEMEGAKKDTSNPFYKSKYADLASVIYAIKEPLCKNNLSYTQLVESNDEGKTFLKTILMHKSGQSISSKMLVKPTRDDMQGLGSAITYARRYSLQAIVGLSSEDDDGNAASGLKNNSSKPEVEMPKRKEEPKQWRIITAGEWNAAITIGLKNGYSKEEIKDYVKTLGYDDIKTINEHDYKSIIEYVDVTKEQRIKIDKSWEEINNEDNS